MTDCPPDGAIDRLVAEMRARPQLFDRSARGVDDLLRDLKSVEGPPDIEAIKRIMQVKLQERARKALGLINAVPKEVAERIVRDALALKHHDAAEQVEAVRISLLRALPGIDTRVASAILCWMKPTLYGVLDRRAWKSLRRFKLVKPKSKHSSYSASDWVKYLFLIRAIAKEMKKTPQKIDTWLYAYDKAKES